MTVTKKTRPLLIATSVFALLAGCDDFGAKLHSYGEAGSVPDYYNIGNSVDMNAGYHTGDYVFDFAQRFHETVPDTVTFAFNSATLDENAKAILRRQAHFIRQFPEVRWKVFGHTDAVGSNYYNQRLGQRRAEAVVAYLSSQGVSRKRLQAVVERALGNGGTVIVPAFSIGRTQELLYEFEDILHRQRLRPGRYAERWAKLPIYLDSPLAGRFTQLYRELQPFWDAEAQRRVKSGRKPLSFEQLVAIDDHKAHEANVRRLARSGEPAIVIAASGMCAGGRVVNYLKAMLHDARHDVLFVGYQARGTAGAAIQTYGPRGGYVDLDGERIEIKAAVHTLSGYSAHADQDGLVRFVTRMRHLPSEVRLIHGDDDARRTLAERLVRETGGAVSVLNG